jgi:hypothetical protein
MTEYELTQLHREREGHKGRMDLERQQQDAELAKLARVVFGWCFCTASVVLGTVAIVALCRFVH